MSLGNSASLKKTNLADNHTALGGNMVDFGGWLMPLWYKTGAVQEHLAVINSAGLFDTSHMTVVLAEGARVKEFINFAVTKDIGKLALERAAYGIVLNEKGYAVDDVLVYPLAEDRYGLVLNAGMGDVVIQHLQTLPGADQIKFTNLSGQIGKLDIQGPAAYSILRPLIDNADAVFEKFPYFSFKGDFDYAQSKIKFGGDIPVLLSRTGYTGELGFEIFMSASDLVKAWDILLKAGGDKLLPCGLAARDSLRTGAVLPLSHQDIGNWPFINNPWNMALPLDEAGNFTKNFLGRDALNRETAEHTLPFIGFDPRKVDADSSIVLCDGEEIGKILTVVGEMAIGRVDGKVVGLASPDKPEGWTPKGLMCGYVKVKKHLPVGATITLKDSRRELKAEIAADIRPNRTARIKLS